ncbi:MAG: rod shape-determining protein MreD [Woeseiaceae bacterium]
MSNSTYSRRIPVFVTIVIALMLSVLPLPGWLEAFRPDWIMITLIYWAMMLPRTWSVGSAWLIGLVLDVAQGTLLGQHALALCVVVFVTVRMHLLMRVFPTGQLVAAVFSLLALYQFILFWINGVAGVPVEAKHYWGPVISGAIIWPVVVSLLNSVRLRVQ